MPSRQDATAAHKLPEAGGAVLLVGSGPSLCADDIELLRGHCYVIACNDNHIYRPDLLYVPDHAWVRHNPECLNHPNRWAPAHASHAKHAGWNTIRVSETSEQPYSLSMRDDFLNHGGFAGFQMLNMAASMRFDVIVLTGYDCQMTNGQLRWRGRHPDGVEKGTDGSKFAKWKKAIESAAPDLDALGIAVINATRSTSLTCFPIMSASEAVAAVKELCSEDRALNA